MADTPGSARELAILPQRWAERLQYADVDDIVMVANDFIASWKEHELSRLPSGCLPPRMRTIEDINNYAFLLKQAQLGFAGSLSTEILLDRMAVFFRRASQRAVNLAFIDRAPKVGDIPEPTAHSS